MLYRGVLIARASGRLGDSVWAHNQGGDYVRALGNPNPNPATVNQAYIRQAYTDLIYLWSILSEEQRQGWYNLSNQTPELGRGGAVRGVGGFAAFYRANVYRSYAQNVGLGSVYPVNDAPESPFAAMNTVGWSFTTHHDNFVFSFPDGSAWGDAGSILFVWTKVNLSLTRRSFRHGWTPTFCIDNTFNSGDEFAAPASFGSGVHHHLRFVLTNSRGQVSPPAFFDVAT